MSPPIEYYQDLFTGLYFVCDRINKLQSNKTTDLRSLYDCSMLYFNKLIDVAARNLVESKIPVTLAYLAFQKMRQVSSLRINALLCHGRPYV